MPRYVAFLRAVNVGGRTVKMAELRARFEELGFADVATFIASGNVIFETTSAEHTLAPTIERHLESAFGFTSAVFIRSAVALARIARYQPFADEHVQAKPATLYVVFLRDRLTAAAQRRVMTLASGTDALHVHGRELWWSCRTSLRASTVSGARIERAIGSPVTVRNANTVIRLAAKLELTS